MIIFIEYLYKYRRRRFFGYLAFWTAVVGDQTKVLFIRSFASMDGDSPQRETDLSQGQATPAPSLSAGPAAATGSPATSAPMFAELKNFLSRELSSFKEELKRQNDDSINSAVKKIRLENSARHSFKSKGNEEQYNHQEKIATHFDSAIESLHSGKLLEVRNVLEEGKNLVATRMKHIVLADLHGWDFVTEYKQIPLAEDESDEKRIRKVLKDVESQREKRNTEKSKKANKFKLDSRRSFPARSYSNEFPVFPSMSGCYLCGMPGHFWRNCYRSRNSPTSGSNAGYSWQRQLVQLPLQPTIMPANQGSK